MLCSLFQKRVHSPQTKGTILTLRNNATPCLVISDFQLLSAGFDQICKTYFHVNGYHVFCINLKALSNELRALSKLYLRGLIQGNGAKPLFVVVDRREIAYTIEEKSGDAFIFTTIQENKRPDETGSSQPENGNVSHGTRPMFRSSHSNEAPPKKSTPKKKKAPGGSNGSDTPKNGSNGAGKKDAKPRKPREKQKGGSASRHIGA
ncbi:MAG: hypothetical protein NUV81_04420 [bacterium]|nr:hypothetical protein [bacterium]